MSADFDAADRAYLAEIGLAGPATDFAAMRAEDRIAAAEEKAALAWNSDATRKGVELAQAALGDSLYCASAFTMLSLFVARDLAERVRLLNLALRAGEAALGARLESEAGKLGASPRGLAYLGLPISGGLIFLFAIERVFAPPPEAPAVKEID